MTVLQVGDIFEYHEWGDLHIAFIAKDERIVIFYPSTAYSDYFIKPASFSEEIEKQKIVNQKNFKLLKINEQADDFKACYLNEFSPLKKGSKVEFNYRGTVISGVVVERYNSYKKIKAKFLINSATLHITAEPYLFTEKP